MTPAEKKLIELAELQLEATNRILEILGGEPVVADIKPKPSSTVGRIR